MLDGANRPINTLDRPPMANSQRTFSSTDIAFSGASKKRQDYDRESTGGNRASKRLRSDPDSSRNAVRLSHDEANDAESIATSTASIDDRRPKQKVCSNQDEFRKTSMGLSPSNGRRRNRGKYTPGTREQRSGEGLRRNSERPESASPDELRISSPPPIVSDIVPPGPKSSRPIQTSTKSGPLPFGGEKHRRKNVPLEEISDDELANDTKQRGRTKPPASSNSTKSRSARLGSKIRLRHAVSGTHIFQPGKDLELVRNDFGTAWGVVTEDGKPIGHPWLQPDAERMTKMHHSPDSEIVVVYRPQARNIPAKLILKFEDEQASRQFRSEVEEASGIVKSEPKKP